MSRPDAPVMPPAPCGSAPRLWLGLLQGARASSLSDQERTWGRQLPPVVRQRYWQSRAALRLWLAGVLGCAPAAVPLHTPPGCPPQLLEEAGWVSLSHSGAALLLGFSRAPLGVDLEPAARPVAAVALMRRCFPPLEVAQLQRFDPEQQRVAVLTSWVLKEAAIKWRRRSLARELTCWQLDHVSGRLRHRPEGLEPECGTGLAAGWRWAGVGAGMGQADLEVAMPGP